MAPDVTALMGRRVQGGEGGRETCRENDRREQGLLLRGARDLHRRRRLLNGGKFQALLFAPWDALRGTELLELQPWGCGAFLCAGLTSEQTDDCLVRSVYWEQKRSCALGGRRQPPMPRACVCRVTTAPVTLQLTAALEGWAVTPAPSWAESSCPFSAEPGVPAQRRACPCRTPLSLRDRAEKKRLLGGRRTS